MSAIVYILIGFAIGSFVTNWVGFNKVVNAIKDLKAQPAPPKEEVQPQKLKGTGRKGLMQKSFTDTETNSSFDAEFEVYEIERSKAKSKVGIISIHVGQGKYGSDSYKRALIGMWDKAWVEISDVEWLDESQELVREDKLNDLLD